MALFQHPTADNLALRSLVEPCKALLLALFDSFDILVANVHVPTSVDQNASYLQGFHGVVLWSEVLSPLLSRPG